MEQTHVVTCFLRNRGEVLLLRRSEAVGSYPGKWGGVAGHVEGNSDSVEGNPDHVEGNPDHAEGDPDRAAREEIAEETGLLDACTLARKGVTFEFTDSEVRSTSESRAKPGDEDLDVRWVVHPYLFDCDSRAVETDWETAETEWVHPTEILRRETVPNLWTSYSRVAPTVQQVAEDSDHGSAYVSVRALEVLRDRAGSFAESGSGEWPQLTALAEQLLDARPSMAAVGNRVDRVMAEAASDDDTTDQQTPEAVERAAREGIVRAFRADEQAAANAAAEIRNAAAEVRNATAGVRNATTEIEDATVLTLSRSGTVLEALPAAERVVVAESRPANEGVGVAGQLANADESTDVTLHIDAAIAHVLATEAIDAVVVGADAILPDGRVVNKVGTRGAALAASREGVPLYAVAASDKVRTDDEVHLEEGDAESVYDGEADLTVLNPTFDVTPADLVSGVVTERGVLDEAEISEVAEELRELAEWRERGPNGGSE